MKHVVTLVVVGWLIALIAFVAQAAPESSPMVIQIAMTESRFTNSVIVTNRQAALLDLWGFEDTAENRAWVDSGWDSGYRSTQNTNITVYVYRVSVLQTKAELKNTLTGPEITRYKNWIQDDPQVKASINRTPDDSLTLWDIERKPSPAIP